MTVKRFTEDHHGPGMLRPTRNNVFDINMSNRPRLDPPEDRMPLERPTVKTAPNTSPSRQDPSSSSTDRNYYSSDHLKTKYHLNDFNPIAIVASRDDDSTRKEFHSKIEALNAKSRELRSITFNMQSYPTSSSPYAYNYSSPMAPSPPLTSSSPTSVMAPSLHTTSPTPLHSGSLIDDIMQKKKLTDAAIDSRIEFLRKQSLAWKRGIAAPITFQANKKVTFESDKSAISSRNPSVNPVNHYTSSLTASVTSHSLPGAKPPLTSTPSFTSAISSASGVTSASPDRAATGVSTPTNTIYSSKSLAMKIMCEKILDGYTMTRNHCPKCSMALMRSNFLGASPNNHDAAVECVFCPIATIRNTISMAVCNRVMAASFSSGDGVVAMNEQSPCESCSSPILLNSQGAAMECSVCPVLDAACVAISREQERGGVFSDSQSCTKCGCPEMSRGNGQINCVVCDTLRMRLGEVQPINPVYSEPRMSPSAIKSNDPPLDPAKVNLAKLHEDLQEELAKAAISQKSLMMRFQPIDQTEESTQREQEVEENPSTLMGNENSSVDFMKLQKQLCTAVKQNASVSGLAKFQDQLKTELAKTKEAQACLVHFLHDSRCSSSNMSRDDLEAELSNAKQHQVTLEKILEGANIIEKATSNDPEFTGGLTDLLETISPGNLSYSISQQEVDATGNVKEYIPPPTFFRHSIPKEVIVYHIPEENECDPSVAEKSHHTHNLKQTERYPPQNVSMFDCCGSSPAAPGNREDNNSPSDDNNYDYETIETDEDYTVDYTLNTVDYGRLEYLRAIDESRLGFNDMRSSHSRTSGSIASVQNDKYQYRMGNKEEKDNHMKSTASSGRCFFMCFNCGGEDDAYSMVESSKRGFTQQDDEQQQYSAQDRNNTDSYHGLEDESVQLVRSPSPFSYNDSVNNESEFGSVNRASYLPIKIQPKSSLRYSDPPTDHNSVQSDLTDHSSANRRVTFGSSCRPGKWENQQLRALTEESDQGEVIDKYSLESVGSALSNHRVEMKRMY